MPFGETLTILRACNLRFDDPANWHARTFGGITRVCDEIVFEPKTTVAVEDATDSADCSF